MTKDEALKRGMELLRSNISAQQWFELQPEINTIKEALAQPEQEPWCVEMNGCKTKCEDCPDKPEQQEQKPVGKFAKFTDGIWREVTDGSAGILLYTIPPKREWVGLTDDDLVACSEAQKATVIYFLAKLKKLNT